MTRPMLLGSALALILSASTFAQDGAPSPEDGGDESRPEAPGSAQDIIDAAPDEAWRAVEPDDMLVFTTAHGDVYVELAPEFAPNHVERMRELAEEGFYDFKVWHRVIDGFMAQGGGSIDDPTASTDKPNLEAEFSIQRDDSLTISELQDRTINPRSDRGRAKAGFWNGFQAATQPIAQASVTESGTVESWLLHCQGAASMARTNDPNSAASQFYITRAEAPHLDHEYTVWGKVRAGQDAVNSIAVGTMGEDMGFSPDYIEQVRPANEIDAAERLQIEVIDTGSDVFNDYLDAVAQENGGSLPNVCDIEIPTRVTE